MTGSLKTTIQRTNPDIPIKALDNILPLIETAIKEGRFLEAHNMAEEGCLVYPDNLRLQQLCGLSMSKSGAVTAAIEFLEPVYKNNPEDAETAGILAGVYKDKFKETANTQFAQKSLDTYLKNYIATGSYYTGINAATMNHIIGRGGKAKEIASKLIEEIGDPQDDIWKLATLGEAYLLAKNYDASVQHYKEASKVGRGKYGQLNSIYSQLLLLKHYIRIPVEIMGFFEPPKVAIFTGHMIDHPDRHAPRFPDSISPDIKKEILGKLEEHGVRIGYCSLACGGDILFAEALLELGGEVNIFLPFAMSDFLETSVEFAGKEWVDRFNSLISRAGVNFITEEKYFGDEDLYHFLGKVLIGSTILRTPIL